MFKISSHIKILFCKLFFLFSFQNFTYCFVERPAITIKQLLLGIQDLLTNPNPKSPAQREAYELYMKSKEEYHKKIREQAMRNAPEDV